MKRLIVLMMLSAMLMCVSTSLQAQDDVTDKTEITLDDNPSVTVSYQQFNEIVNQPSQITTQATEKAIETSVVVLVVKPPAGCGTDSNGTKYCCYQSAYGGVCLPVNW